MLSAEIPTNLCESVTICIDLRNHRVQIYAAFWVLVTVTMFCFSINPFIPVHFNIYYGYFLEAKARIEPSGCWIFVSLSTTF